ncbi:hypothetical protein [Chryseobacterium sp. 52]|uniref:hypothetical protein n=1 Tax=Chryseobacterium sp. 52 TaxID=2035213 RepID=UPI00117F0988|nr:hypothetical protein [Chryseobacterium sp. 52]
MRSSISFVLLAHNFKKSKLIYSKIPEYLIEIENYQDFIIFKVKHMNTYAVNHPMTKNYHIFENRCSHDPIGDLRKCIDTYFAIEFP